MLSWWRAPCLTMWVIFINGEHHAWHENYYTICALKCLNSYVPASQLDLYLLLRLCNGIVTWHRSEVCLTARDTELQHQRSELSRECMVILLYSIHIIESLTLKWSVWWYYWWYYCQYLVMALLAWQQSIGILKPMWMGMIEILNKLYNENRMMV